METLEEECLTKRVNNLVAGQEMCESKAALSRLVLLDRDSSARSKEL